LITDYYFAPLRCEILRWACLYVYVLPILWMTLCSYSTTQRRRQ